MRASRGLWAGGFVLLALTSAVAQVLSPLEIADPGPRSLQERYIGTLQAAAAQMESLKYPYHFYFSRALDVEEQKQRQLDQRSISFAKYGNQTVLQITGNYYASYHAASMDGNARARRTFLDVVLPLLKAEVPLFPADQDFQAFALEVSHHVRGKVMGVQTENAENLAVLIPRAAAKKLVNAKGLEEQQAAILESKVFLDGEPIQLWLADEPPPPDWNKRAKQRAAAPAGAEIASLSTPPVAPEPSVSPALIKAPEMPVRLIAPDTLKKLQATHDDAIARMLKELGPQANFVSYAPPAFIAFHQGAYLQLSMTTNIQGSGSLTRYGAAALAFEDHVSHLVRPMLAFFPEDYTFDGVDFSTTVKAAGTGPVAVEFMLPFAAMRCYSQYDCTGQQLIDAGVVLINGERAGLDLQRAEAGK